MPYFPSGLMPSNLKDESADVRSNENVVSAADFNKHDEEIRAIEAFLGATPAQFPKPGTVCTPGSCLPGGSAAPTTDCESAATGSMIEALTNLSTMLKRIRDDYVKTTSGTMMVKNGSTLPPLTTIPFPADWATSLAEEVPDDGKTDDEAELPTIPSLAIDSVADMPDSGHVSIINDIDTVATMNVPPVRQLVYTSLATTQSPFCNIGELTNSIVLGTDSSTYTVGTFAGNGTAGDTDGPATGPCLKAPTFAAVADDGTVYVSSVMPSGKYKVKRIASGQVSTYVGGAAAGTFSDGVAATSIVLDGVQGLAVDSEQNLYVNTGSIIFKVNQSDKTVYGLAYAANLKGVAIASDGIVYANGNSVQKMILSSGIPTVLSGNVGTAGFSGDGGAATAALLSGPTCVSIDGSGNVYVSDAGNLAIRKISSADGTISTVAGRGPSTSDNVPATNFAFPAGSSLLHSCDSDGNIYISSNGAAAYRISSSNNYIQTIATNGLNGFSGTFYSAAGIAISKSGAAYLCDSDQASGNRVYEIVPQLQVDSSGQFVAFAKAGRDFSYTLRAIGTPPIVISISNPPMIPGTSNPMVSVNGTTITANGADLRAGSYSMTVKASNGSVSVTKSMVLYVAAASSPTLQFTSISGKVGSPIQAYLMGSFDPNAGLPARFFVESGSSLPSGLSLMGNLITGIPTSAAVGTRTASITVVDRFGDSKTSTVTFTIGNRAMISAGGTYGQTYPQADGMMPGSAYFGNTKASAASGGAEVYVADSHSIRWLDNGPSMGLSAAPDGVFTYAYCSDTVGPNVTLPGDGLRTRIECSQTYSSHTADGSYATITTLGNHGLSAGMKVIVAGWQWEALGTQAYDWEATVYDVPPAGLGKTFRIQTALGSGSNPTKVGAILNRVSLSPLSMSFDNSDNLYVADGINRSIRKIARTPGTMDTDKLISTYIQGATGLGQPASTAGINAKGQIMGLSQLSNIVIVGGVGSGGSFNDKSFVVSPTTSGLNITTTPALPTTDPNGPTRSNACLVRLIDGRLLLIGGEDKWGTPKRDCWLYSGGTWSTTGSLNGARTLAKAVLLPSGKVLAAGGIGAVTTATAEVYDPLVGTWYAVGPMARPRKSFSMEVCNGHVVVAGGTDASNTVVTDSQAFDYASETWSWSIQSLASYNAASAVLPTGNVLICGGVESGADTNISVLYNPSTRVSAGTGSMNRPRSSHTATRLGDGRVLVVGGWSELAHPDGEYEIYNPGTGQWQSYATPVGSQLGRTNHTASLLRDGSVMIAGGVSGTVLSSVWVFSPWLNTWAGPLKVFWSGPSDLPAAVWKHAAAEVPFVGDAITFSDSTFGYDVYGGVQTAPWPAKLAMSSTAPTSTAPYGELRQLNFGAFGSGFAGFQQLSLLNYNEERKRFFGRLTLHVADGDEEWLAYVQEGSSPVRIPGTRIKAVLPSALTDRYSIIGSGSRLATSLGNIIYVIKTVGVNQPDRYDQILAIDVGTGTATPLVGNPTFGQPNVNEQEQDGLSVHLYGNYDKVIVSDHVPDVHYTTGTPFSPTLYFLDYGKHTTMSTYSYCIAAYSFTLAQVDGGAVQFVGKRTVQGIHWFTYGFPLSFVQSPLSPGTFYATIRQGANNGGSIGLVEVKADSTTPRFVVPYGGKDPEGNTIPESSSLEIDAVGNLYVTSSASGVIWKIDPATGVFSRFIGATLSSGILKMPTSVSVSRGSSYLYVYDKAYRALLKKYMLAPSSISVVRKDFDCGSIAAYIEKVFYTKPDGAIGIASPTGDDTIAASSDATSVSVDGSGNVYWTEGTSHSPDPNPNGIVANPGKVKRADYNGSNVTVLAGNDTYIAAWISNVPAGSDPLASSLITPTSVVVPPGPVSNVYFMENWKMGATLSAPLSSSMLLRGLITLTFSPPAPATLSSVLPTSGDDTVEVILLGSNFSQGIQVFFGNSTAIAIPASKLTRVNSTELRAKVSIGIGKGLSPLALSSFLLDAYVRNPGDLLAVGQLGAFLFVNPTPAAVAGSFMKQSPPLASYNLGTNVEIMRYSGIDSVSSPPRLLNVRRRQSGSTSTRHAKGDLVFKGRLSLEVAPVWLSCDAADVQDFLASTDPPPPKEGARLSAMECLLRSDSKVDVRARVAFSSPGTPGIAHAAYNAILVMDIPPVPPFTGGNS